MSFDLSNPKILIGLMIGGMIPYFVLEVPTTITKWVLLARIAGLRPTIGRLVVVAIAEIVCLVVATAVLTWLGYYRFFGLAVYAILATLPNLLLFPSANPNQHGSHPVLKKCLSAFGLGLLYPLWMYFFFLSYWAWHGKP